MSSKTTVTRPALHQPVWPSEDELRLVRGRLSTEMPPVERAVVSALVEELARCCAGEAFVVMGGDCAELFSEATPPSVIEKAAHLHRLADMVTGATGLPTTRIGRFGGQFAKPRSQPYEQLSNGEVVFSYMGDAVNGLSTDQRTPDPRRLLTAHRCSADAVRALRTWDWSRPEVAGSLNPPGKHLRGPRGTSLGLQTRAVARSGAPRCQWPLPVDRGPDAPSQHGHIAFAAAVDNPVGVKLGPSTAPDDVRALMNVLAPPGSHRPGRLTFIVRMGADHCTRLLPPLVEALGDRARDVLWMLDPMHGNGRTNIHGQKTRLMTDLQHEVTAFFQVLARHGLKAGGIHLEMTHDPVTECVSSPSELARWLPEHRSACDPRLNPAQAFQLMELVANQLSATR